MKLIALGDIHGRSIWKKIIEIEHPETVIFVGDYFDTLDDISAIEQMNNFKEIVEYKKSGKANVILLIGNHDYHYFPEIGFTGITGYQAGAAPAISQLLDENRAHLQMAYSFGDFVFSHAGISPIWLKENGWEEGDYDIVEFTNDLWKFKPQVFKFTGLEPTGDNMSQTPIWIRPGSLMKAAEAFSKDIIQIVGHTRQKQIDRNGKEDGRYYFIDALGTSREYVVLNGGVISVESLK